MTIASPSWLGLLGVIGLLACDCAPVCAQQFSADLVSSPVDGVAASSGKLRALNDKVRIEAVGFSDGFFLVDGANRVAYFARPADRIVMDARQSSRLTRMFVSLDPSDPCRQWQDMAKLAGVPDQADQWRCERVGQETIDGRATVAYRAISSSGPQMTGWIDAELKFPLRIRTEDGTTFEMKHIQEEPQPARLFEIPTSFRKFDPQALINRIKQSDVWVEESKP
jgi:hypothetical protein